MQDVQGEGSAVRPFRVNISQLTVDRILARVRESRWPDRMNASDWRYGTNWDYMRELAQYWTTQFDWRLAESKLNRYEQFIARVDDLDIYYYHVRAKSRTALPLILTHGWPGSVFEFNQAIGPLTDPARFGGSEDEAFDVIIPSLPGFGFSSKPRHGPLGRMATARLWHKLMTNTLGYHRYGAQGGDWGAAVTVGLAMLFQESLIGIHLNAAPYRQVPEAQQTWKEREWERRANAYSTSEFDYFGEQQRKPQTVAFALSDNPLGTAAWIIEKFKIWSDSPKSIEDAFTKDQLLTNIMLYLVTDTVGTSVWFYRGAMDEQFSLRSKITAPTGFAAFPKEMPNLSPPEERLRRDFNLIRYTEMPRGGHFACFEQPDLFVRDVRAFFATFRT
jgi:microsomal epoxide hydrolase